MNRQKKFYIKVVNDLVKASPINISTGMDITKPYHFFITPYLNDVYKWDKNSLGVLKEFQLFRRGIKQLYGLHDSEVDHIMGRYVAKMTGKLKRSRFLLSAETDTNPQPPFMEE
jgi:hypothetical protein